MDTLPLFAQPDDPATSAMPASPGSPATADPIAAAVAHVQRDAQAHAAALAHIAAAPDDPAPPDGTPVRGRLLLIDGYALLYRAFYAMIGKPLRSSRGENTSATWGVAHALWRYVADAARAEGDQRFDAVAWVMDAGRSGRMELYPAYKATREKLADELRAEFEQSVQRARELLAAFGVLELRIDGWEADDVIGTVATRAAREGWHVVILSGDKDFHQLVGRRVHLLNPGRGGPAAVPETLVTLANAHERLGVPPHQVVDFLALIGDSSDNVPGVKGVGEKTAQQLLTQFGTLERVLEVAHSLPQKRPREALQTHADAARLSKLLVTIRRDVPGLPSEVPIADLAPKPLDKPLLAALLHECEFTSLLGRWDLKGVTPNRAGVARFAAIGPDDLDDLANDAAAAGLAGPLLGQVAQDSLPALPDDDLGFELPF